MAYTRINDYGIVGDGDSVALVSRDGAVDWLCLPYVDSPSVFGALLDERRGGRFAVRPRGRFDSVQHYVDRTNVLATHFRTEQGELELIDLMPVDRAAGRLLRRARVLSGRIELDIECSARFDYARQAPQWSAVSDQVVALRGGELALSLAATLPLSWQHERACTTLVEGETLWLRLDEACSMQPPSAEALERTLEATTAFWRNWVDSKRTGRYPAQGFWQHLLDRSALVLKLLQVRETGAVAAAATTSLPAIVHGERNWDYRYSWIRDSSMTVAALFRLGYHDEATRYLDWLATICQASEDGDLDIVYQLREPAPPGDETTLPHLAGYKNSAPVRIGQYVIHQRQHDIYGALLETLFVVSHYTGKIGLDNWQLFRPLVDRAISVWREPDDGIWEARVGAQHYTHSKLMCWVAVDRGIKIAEHYGLSADLPRWNDEREAMRADILAHGYDARRGSFVQCYGGTDVDAALLLIPLMGFLPADDPRVTGTVCAIEQDLRDDGVLMRYVARDGLSGQEGGFLICWFWYLETLLLQGRTDEVDTYLRTVPHYASPLGLFGEQYDPRWREITGNFPQAYSHLGYVSVLLKYLDARHAPARTEPLDWSRRLRLLWRHEILNPPGDTAGRDKDSGSPATQLSRAMHILRGHFYDGHAQRVAYERIRGSEYYEDFSTAAAALADFDPATLQGDAERIAFWVNVFNVIVIHGVIELGIRSSVRELPRFFDRIAYRVGGHTCSADDIEHGMLRGNRAPPWRWRRLRRNDPRLAWVVQQPDPRIHFALVCASKTCPPIEAYDAARLQHQLDTSATVFINGTTRFDARSGTLHVSEIFRWYRDDFGRDDQALARYIGGYLYDQKCRGALVDGDRRIELAFTPYDWRLNR